MVRAICECGGLPRDAYACGVRSGVRPGSLTHTLKYDYVAFGWPLALALAALVSGVDTRIKI